MRYMYVLCGNMMNDPQHCCLYSPQGYLATRLAIATFKDSFIVSKLFIQTFQFSKWQ